MSWQGAIRVMAVGLACAGIGCSASNQQGESSAPEPVGAVPDDNALDAQNAARIACFDRRVWGRYLRQDSAATIDEILGALGQAEVALDDEEEARVRERLKPVVKWRLIRFLLVEGQNHNFGRVRMSSLRRADGEPVVLYRSGFTTDPGHPDSCFRSLLERGGVRHVINLYAGVMPTEDLEAAERQAAHVAGASYFTMREASPALSSWRYEIDEHGDDPAVVRRAMENVARLLNEEVLRPGGAAPRGNIHLHCGGGMHRTGMLVGILERCLNDKPMSAIEADYKHHVDWRSDEEPGGYEAGNLAFIESFDCSLLRP